MSFFKRLFGTGEAPTGASISERTLHVRDAARRYITAEEPRERMESLAALTAVWATLRDRAEAAERLTPRFPTVHQVEELLRATLHDDSPTGRSAAAAPLVAMFDLVDRGLTASGTPAEPGAAWRPDRPPPTRPEKEERLAQARADTRRTARSMADAVRKVVAARRQRAVPLYATFSNEVRATYAAAATDFALGLTPMAPYQPGTTKRTAPWGLFKVRSDVPLAEAAVRFAVSPPLPVRGELLEARSTPIKLPPLHPVTDASAPRATDAMEGDDAIA